MVKRNINNIDSLKKEIEDSERKIKFKEDAFDNYINIAKSYPNINNEDTNALFLKYIISKDRDIKDIIFKCYLKDVYETCDDKTGYRLDLISEGYTLLYQLIDLYDPRDYKNMPFRTYLKVFLSTLYERLTRINEESLDTEMSIDRLISYESKDIDLTEESKESKLFTQKYILKKEEEKTILS